MTIPARARLPGSRTRCQGRFGQGFSGAEDVDDLLLAGGVDSMDVDRAFLRDVEALRGSAFAKEVVAFVERLDQGDVRNGIQVARRESGKKPAAAQGAGNRGLPKVCK